MSNPFTIALMAREIVELEALAVQYHTTPAAIVEAFVADLTGSLRSGGLEEQELAIDWFDQCVELDYDEEPPRFIARPQATEGAEQA